MSIQDLGNLGELIASVAVVISLAYLAMQIRQSNRAARLASRQTILDKFLDATADLARHPHMLKVIGDSISGYEDLTNDEKALLNQSMHVFAGNLYNAILLREAGLLDDEPFEYIANAFMSYPSTEGGRMWWFDSKSLFPDSLIEYVERRMAERPVAPLHEQAPYYDLKAEAPEVRGAGSSKRENPD